MLTLAALSVTGCKPVANVSTTAFILGPSDDIHKIDTNTGSDIPQSVQNAAVLLATTLAEGGRKLCSGTLIAPANGENNLRVLTNHHCFASVDQGGEVASQVIAEACTGTVVYLGFVDSNAKNAKKVQCAAKSLRTDVTGDLAVFSIEGDVPSEFGPLSFWSKDSVPVDRDALIVHFPDVAQNYTSVGNPPQRLPVAAATSENCKTAGDFPRSEWKLDKTLPYSLQHTCDLEHGSSGSALVDRETLAILAVNWGGIKINYNSNSRLTNVATKVDYVQAFLNGDTTQIRQYRLQQDADAVAANKTNDEKSAQKSRLSDKLKAGCGVITAGTPGPKHLPQAAVLSIIFSLPLFYAFLRKH